MRDNQGTADEYPGLGRVLLAVVVVLVTLVLLFG
jgi:hypothetical protein